MKIAIFDLDNTLINTEVLKKYRDSRDWKKVFNNIHLTEISENVKEVILAVKDTVDKCIIVTSSPSNYSRQVLEHHSFLQDLEIVGYHDTKEHKPSAKPYLKAISKLGLNIDDIEQIYIFGDEKKDFIAAENLKGNIKSKILKILCKWYTEADVDAKVDCVMDKCFKKEQLNEIFS